MIDFEIVFWSNKGVLGAGYTLKWAESRCIAVHAHEFMSVITVFMDYD